MSFPPELLEEMLREYPVGRVISLDDFADRVAPHGLDSDQIDALLGALEAADREVHGGASTDPKDLPATLGEVLAHARRFVEEHGRRPSADELAAYAGLSPSAVKRALAFGRSIAR
jgi:hypothetical protein